MDHIQSAADNIISSSILHCSDYTNKNYTDCYKCANCVGLNNLGDVVCWNEINYTVRFR